MQSDAGTFVLIITFILCLGIFIALIKTRPIDREKPKYKKKKKKK